MTPQEPRDPFRDSAENVKDHMDTLVVGRDASLTLGTDSLIVLDEGLAQHAPPRWSNCCDLLPSQKSLPTRAIPFYNILHASLDDFDITIHYANHISSSVVRAACISYSIDKAERVKAGDWIEHLLDKTYRSSRRQKRIKVLVNPFGGSGKAQKMFLRDIEPVFAAARCDIDMERTQYSGHATEIAEKLDIERYDVIASCSGDGLPHEVFNGFGKRVDAAKALATVAVVQLPCGTGNAMSLNLNGTNSPSMAALAIVKGLRTPLDLVSVTQGDRRTLSFLSQAVGIVAETDLGTEHLRWMGDARFTFGFLLRLLGKIVYPCDIAVGALVEEKPAIREHCRKEVASVSVVAKDSSSDSSTSDSSTQVPAQSLHRPHDGADDSEGGAGAGAGPEPGLPPLRFGTVQDALPASWQMKSYSTLGNFYAGNMPLMAADTNFFQAALPSDGCLDVVNVPGDIGILAAVQCLLALSKGGSFFDVKHVSYRKVEGYRIVPRPVDGRGRRVWGGGRDEGVVAIDGERIPFEPFQVEVHRGLGTVLSRRGRVYEAPPLV